MSKIKSQVKLEDVADITLQIKPNTVLFEYENDNFKILCKTVGENKGLIFKGNEIKSADDLPEEMKNDLINSHYKGYYSQIHYEKDWSMVEPCITVIDKKDDRELINSTTEMMFDFNEKDSKSIQNYLDKWSRDFLCPKEKYEKQLPRFLEMKDISTYDMAVLRTKDVNKRLEFAGIIDRQYDLGTRNINELASYMEEIAKGKSDKFIEIMIDDFCKYGEIIRKFTKENDIDKYNQFMGEHIKEKEVSKEDLSANLENEETEFSKSFRKTSSNKNLWTKKKTDNVIENNAPISTNEETKENDKLEVIDVPKEEVKEDKVSCETNVSEEPKPIKKGWSINKVDSNGNSISKSNVKTEPIKAETPSKNKWQINKVSNSSNENNDKLDVIDIPKNDTIQSPQKSKWQINRV